MVLVPEKFKQKTPPRYNLVYEVLDGKTFYRKSYQDVLNKTKTIEDIMPCSKLQFYVIDYLLGLIYSFVNRREYAIATNEAGLHLKKRGNTGNDIAIYSKKVLTPDQIDEHYADVPPKIIIEVDIKVDLEKMTVAEYLQLRTKVLLDFGVEKVIWVLTKSQKIVVGKQGKALEIVGWGEDVEIMDGHYFNVLKYLKEEGIPFIEREA